MANKGIPEIIVTAPDAPSKTGPTIEKVNQSTSANRLKVPAKNFKHTLNELELLERKVRKIARRGIFTEAATIASLTRYYVTGRSVDLLNEEGLIEFVMNIKDKSTIGLYLDKKAREPLPTPVVAEPESKKIRHAQLEKVLKKTIRRITNPDVYLSKEYSAIAVLDSVKEYIKTGNTELLISDGPLKKHIITNNILPDEDLRELVDEHYAAIVTYTNLMEARSLKKLEERYQVAFTESNGKYTQEDILHQLHTGRKITHKGELKDLVKLLPPHLVKNFVMDKMATLLTSGNYRDVMKEFKDKYTTQLPNNLDDKENEKNNSNTPN